MQRFAKDLSWGGALEQVAAETGLSVPEVFQRQLDLKLISVGPTGDSDCNVQISS